MRGLDDSRWAGMCLVMCCTVCCVGWGHVFYFWPCIIAGWEYARMYMMMGWSPGMDDSIDACMHVCVFSVFLLYIIIIILL